MSALPRRNDGFTLVELMIAMSIFLLLIGNVWMVTKAGRDAAASGVFNMTLSDELDLTVDRISLAIMAANAEEIDGPQAEPVASSSVTYSSKLGMNDGSIVRGPVEEIAWLPTGGKDGRVVWREYPETLEEREVNWSNSVPVMFEDEIDKNGTDDNNNGVTDEGGLGFTQYGSRVDIYVTVERVNSNGKRVPISKSHPVTCRN